MTQRSGALLLGMVRVVGVRVQLGDNGPVSEVIGVLRRRPVVQRISLRTAAELAARGAPLVLRDGAQVPGVHDGGALAEER